jgi:hypothetical protein
VPCIAKAIVCSSKKPKIPAKKDVNVMSKTKICKYCGLPVLEPLKSRHLECRKKYTNQRKKEHYYQTRVVQQRYCQDCHIEIQWPLKKWCAECKINHKRKKKIPICRWCHQPILIGNANRRYHRDCLKLHNSEWNKRYSEKCRRKQGIKPYIKYTEEDYRRYAEAHNGQYLGMGNNNCLIFKCEYGHQFQKSWSECRIHHEWCKRCDRVVHPKQYAELHQTPFLRQEGNDFWFMCSLHGEFKIQSMVSRCPKCCQWERTQKKYAKKGIVVNMTQLIKAVGKLDPVTACKAIKCDPAVNYFTTVVFHKLNGDQQTHQAEIIAKIRKITKVGYKQNDIPAVPVIVGLALYSEFGKSLTQEWIANRVGICTPTLRTWVKRYARFFRPELRVKPTHFITCPLCHHRLTKDRYNPGRLHCRKCKNIFETMELKESMK